MGDPRNRLSRMLRLLPDAVIFLEISLTLFFQRLQTQGIVPLISLEIPFRVSPIFLGFLCELLFPFEFRLNFPCKHPRTFKRNNFDAQKALDYCPLNSLGVA